ncbi:short chain dehydrogenase oxidoreductase [Fusarium circinatum]|uniref:Short chain dehydrogenase oxidoreductase n=1 Tax=Fusarium circinatum TaxID=48490 RepID=A0A8H5WJ06_FUSCI|nr:short chain dehydrogenase oxidoreductase [Fusarium circinatum]
MDLTRKVAIVTGCSSGVGLCTTEVFLSLGAKVLGLDRTPCSLDRPGFRFQMCDIGRSESIKEAVDVYRATYGSKLDILANVAGVMDAFASADTMTDDVWERNININVKGPTLLSREILPLMKNRGQGSIINVGSVATNIIQSVPGGFDGIDKAGYAASQEFVAIHIPPGTEPTLRVEHIANTIAFLASDLSEGITGAIIPVDRGWSFLISGPTLAASPDVANAYGGALEGLTLEATQPILISMLGTTRWGAMTPTSVTRSSRICSKHISYHSALSTSTNTPSCQRKHPLGTLGGSVDWSDITTPAYWDYGIHPYTITLPTSRQSLLETPDPGNTNYVGAAGFPLFKFYAKKMVGERAKTVRSTDGKWDCFATIGPRGDRVRILAGIRVATGNYTLRIKGPETVGYKSRGKLDAKFYAFYDSDDIFQPFGDPPYLGTQSVPIVNREAQLNVHVTDPHTGWRIEFKRY